MRIQTIFRWSILIIVLISTMITAQTPGAFLGELTWPEAEQKIQIAPFVIIPFAGGAKEHGPHLPMNADRVVMDYLCKRGVENYPVLVAPPVLHGWFAAFRDFPGTHIANSETFSRYLKEIAESLIHAGANRILFLNLGVFKASGLPMAIVARELRATYGIPTLLVSWEDLETDEALQYLDQKGGGHADESETSINLYLQPDLVHMDKAVTDYWDSLPLKRYPGYRPGLFSRNPGDPAYSETGLYGDPTLATAEKGKAVLEIMTRNWFKVLKGFSEEPLIKKKEIE
ncbi:creatininase family protein [bacterium]|nr:creatininase family protein [bacterium]